MINKSFSQAPVAIVLVVVTTALAASVSQLTAATNEEQIRVQNELISRIQCVDVYKNDKKSIVCGDPLPPTLDILKAKSAVASFTEQTNNELGQPRPFLNLDYLKKPDPVNVYMQPPQQYVPQPQIVLQQPQYVQPQVHLVLSQIYPEQPQVHYVQPPAPQVHTVQYQPMVYQKPQCQTPEQCLPSYGGGGYYGRSVVFLYYPTNLMKSVETGELVKPGEDVLQQTTYTPKTFNSDLSTHRPIDAHVPTSTAVPVITTIVSDDELDSVPETTTSDQVLDVIKNKIRKYDDLSYDADDYS